MLKLAGGALMLVIMQKLFLAVILGIIAYLIEPYLKSYKEHRQNLKIYGSTYTKWLYKTDGKYVIIGDSILERNSYIVFRADGNIYRGTYLGKTKEGHMCVVSDNGDIIGYQLSELTEDDIIRIVRPELNLDFWFRLKEKEE